LPLLIIGSLVPSVGTKTISKSIQIWTLEAVQHSAGLQW
jgi:hypothetical protein